jgi:pilus assembly protein CpaF
MITENTYAVARRHHSAELDFQKLKTSVHEELVESLDLTVVGEIDDEQMRQEVREISEEICQSRRLSLEDAQRQRLLDEIEDEVFGLGPIEPLMHDHTISDILVNGADEVYVERHGRLEETGIIFADDDHVLRIVQRVVARVSRRIDEVSPMVDARLADGSRINAVVPPVSLDGPKLSIRRFGAERLTIEDLIANESLTDEMARFLEAAAASRVSYLISGGTGAGKTTLLNALTAAIPEDERIVTIEDSAELALMHRHVVRMETRPPNTEGVGEISQRELVKNSLRMRPDRILVGEVRGSEALDMLQAMNTGHEGSLTTIHANDTRDALARLEMMVAMTGFELPVNVVRQYIAAGIKMVVHLSRLKGGVRKVMRISEIVDVADGQYKLEEVFGFRQEGLDSDRTATGHFYATGYQPQCLERFDDFGVELDNAMFRASR